MPTYFLDTSVLVAYFEREDARSVQLIEEVLTGQATAAISLLTVAELWAAPDMADETTERERLALTTLLDVIPLDLSLACRGGELRRLFNLALPDGLIAACAERAGGRFISKDPHYFRLLRAGALDGEIYG